MAFYPQSTSGLAVTTYPAGPTVGGAQITGGSANTKGSYTEVIASSAVTTNSINLVCFTGTNFTDGFAQLLDLATGAGGAESVIIANLCTDMANTTVAYDGVFQATFPARIASGTRVAARCQGTNASSLMGIAVTTIAAGSMEGITSFTTYGANTADSGATQVDPGGSINTKGSYSEITSSTSALAQFGLVAAAFQGHSFSGGTAVGGTWAIDIATGAGGAETVLWSDLRVRAVDNVSACMTYTGRMHGFLTYIPASTRIAARASSDSVAATGRLIDVAVICGTAPSESSSGGSGGTIPPMIAAWSPVRVN